MSHEVSLPPQAWRVLKGRGSSAAAYSLPEQIPPQPGLYLLSVGDTVEYVGCSTNIQRRLSGGHAAYKRGIHKIVIVPLANRWQGHRFRLESRLIRQLEPRLNIRDNPGVPPWCDPLELARKVSRRKQSWWTPAKFARLRRDMGETVEQFAKRFEVTPGTIRRWEREFPFSMKRWRGDLMGTLETRMLVAIFMPYVMLGGFEQYDRWLAAKQRKEEKK